MVDCQELYEPNGEVSFHRRFWQLKRCFPKGEFYAWASGSRLEIGGSTVNAKSKIQFQLFRALMVFAWTVGYFLSTVLGQDVSPSTQLENVLRERARLASSSGTSPSISSPTDTAPIDPLESGRNRMLDTVLLQHESKLRQLVAVMQKIHDARVQIEETDSFEPDEAAPYSFLKLESLRNSMEQETHIERMLKSYSDSLKKAVLASKTDLAEKGKAVAGPSRRSDDPANKIPKANIEHEFRLASLRLALQQTELELTNGQLEICAMKQKELKAKIKVYAKGAKFSTDDLETKKAELTNSNSAMQEMRIASDVLTSRLIALRVQLADLKQDSKLAIADDLDRELSVSIEMSEAVRLHSLEISECLLEAIGQWKRRFDLLTGSKYNLSDLKDWNSSLTDLLERVDTQLETIHQKTDEFQLNASKLSNAKIVAESGIPNEASTANQESRRLIDSSISRCVQELQSLKSSLTRFRQEMKEAIAKTSTLWNSNPIEWVIGIFSYELVEVDDEGIPVSRAIILIFLIALGVYLSFLASRLLAKYLFPFLGVKPGVAVAIRSILRYSLCIFFGVVAFKLMGIPLTAFAFLGGAAAIAVGFGSQDVMNNFMSGIILLTEQPIRVGDVILLSENQCIVTHIGMRSTRVRNYQNHELIVPNTMLIEKMVTNLTLSDNLLRLVVPIVVDRTEPIKESMRLIIDALKKESRVHQKMEPIVLLKEVDTYYLTLEVHFTIEFTDPMESLVAQSNILAVIGQLFPTKVTETKDDAEASSESTNTESSSIADAGKLTRDQLEKQIKNLQAILVRKK